MTKWQQKARNRDHNRCVMCGSKRRIHVHHKDESRRLGYKLMNNKLSNLICLCFRCHQKIHGITPVIPHKRKIISLRRSGASLQDIAIALNLGTKTSAHYVLKKANKIDPTIEEENLKNMILRLN